jgi:hypothetical protein
MHKAIYPRKRPLFDLGSQLPSKAGQKLVSFPAGSPYKNIPDQAAKGAMNFATRGRFQTKYELRTILQNLPQIGSRQIKRMRYNEAEAA